MVIDLKWPCVTLFCPFVSGYRVASTHYTSATWRHSWLPFCEEQSRCWYLQWRWLRIFRQGAWGNDWGCFCYDSYCEHDDVSLIFWRVASWEPDDEVLRFVSLIHFHFFIFLFSPAHRPEYIWKQCWGACRSRASAHGARAGGNPSLQERHFSKVSVASSLFLKLDRVI